MPATVAGPASVLFLFPGKRKHTGLRLSPARDKFVN